MARVRRFGTQVVSTAAPEALYWLLADAPSWSSWAGPLVTRSSWETPPGPDGSGGVRRLGRPPFMVREEIVVADPPREHRYRMLSGQPVRSYQAEVHITALESGAPGGSRIEWSGTVVALVPGTGWLVARMLSAMVAGFARRLAATPGPDEPRR